jgi:hypothetical protein
VEDTLSGSWYACFVSTRNKRNRETNILAPGWVHSEVCFREMWIQKEKKISISMLKRGGNSKEMAYYLELYSRCRY